MTQTQKLLYISYGLKLALEKTLITSEKPQAWPFGPVFPRVHRIVDFSKAPAEISPNIDKSLQELFAKIVGAFGRIPAKKLSEWSHSLGSPWDKTPKDKWGIEISTNDIYNYFLNFNSSIK